MLDDPVIQDFFAATEKDLVEVMINAKDPEARDAAQYMIHLTRKFKRHLEQFLENRDFALAELEKMREAS